VTLGPYLLMPNLGEVVHLHPRVRLGEFIHRPYCARCSIPEIGVRTPSE